MLVILDTSKGALRVDENKRVTTSPPPRREWLTRHEVRPGAGIHTHAVEVTFMRGTSLRAVPPGGTGKDARWIDIHENDLDEAQMTAWLKQAARCPAGSRS